MTRDEVFDRAAVTPSQARGQFRGGLRVPTSGWSAGWAPSFVIGHVPGHMAITDARDSVSVVP